MMNFLDQINQKTEVFTKVNTDLKEYNELLQKYIIEFGNISTKFRLTTKPDPGYNVLIEVHCQKPYGSSLIIKPSEISNVIKTLEIIKDTIENSDIEDLERKIKELHTIEKV